MRTGWISLILLLIFAFGCAPSQTGGPEKDLAQSTPLAPPSQKTLSTPLSDVPQGDTTAMTPTTPADAGVQNLINKAVADLAQRLSIPVTQIKLMEAREIIWPDASLGCPQPGIVYAQVPVNGLLIRLGVGKEMYFYHTAGTADLFLCESTSPVIPNVTPKTDERVPPPDSEID